MILELKQQIFLSLSFRDLVFNCLKTLSLNSFKCSLKYCKLFFISFNKKDARRELAHGESKFAIKVVKKAIKYNSSCCCIVESVVVEVVVMVIKMVKVLVFVCVVVSVVMMKVEVLLVVLIYKRI
jgi:hypothetical protein